MRRYRRHVATAVVTAALVVTGFAVGRSTAVQSKAARPSNGSTIEHDSLVAKNEAGPHNGGGQTTGYSFFTLPYLNMTVASDPESSWQVRLKGKTLKALTGDRVAYFGDHVEMSEGGYHFLMWDDPQWLQQQVRGFIAGK